MKRLFSALLLFPLLAVSQSDPLSYVNPFIGTGGHGHTYPGATAPFGLVQLSPDTRLDGWDGCSGYHYSDSVIYGFSHTHLSGTGVSDYGDLLLMPHLNGPDTSQDYAYRTAFSHEEEQASPAFYRVKMKNGITVSLSATTYSGFHRYEYPEAENQWVVLRFDHRDQTSASAIKRTGPRTFVGYRHSKAWATDQKLFFTLEFDQNVEMSDAVGSVLTGDSHPRNVREVWFRGKGNKLLQAKMSLSGVDEAGALLNHGQTSFSFEKALQNSQEQWRTELGKIRVSGDETSMRKFYSALYHTQIVPNRFSDADGWYRGIDGQLHEARYHTQYTVFSLWDTHRAAHPLYTLTDEKRTLDYLHSFLMMYKQAGHLPVWELAGNETWCMIGYHSASVIADAVMKGLVDTAFARELLAAMIGTAEANRYGLETYRRKGYLEISDESESVSKTLEYAYNDWCISRVAAWLGETGLARKHDYRSRSWVNMIDPKTGLMRPRNNGGFLTPFDPWEVNNNFTEANSWQYSFYVPHDISGFTGSVGGPIRLERLLDSLFSVNSTTTGRNQADITGLIGQYAHGNEPSHHMAYLYNSLGKPHKTQALVDAILDTLYHDAPDGLSGNEDCGQMSAWLVMSSLGIYPIAPGNVNYALIAPAFPTASLQLENGKVFEFRRKGDGKFVQSVTLNGRDWPNNYLPHDSIRQGGLIVFQMGNALSAWGIKRHESWRSATSGLLIPAPAIQAAGMGFYDSLKINWQAHPGARIRYTLDGSDPHSGTDALVNSLVIHQSTHIRMIQYLPGSLKNGRPAYASDESEAYFHRIPEKWKLSWSVAPKKEYAAGGESTLIDALYGDDDWRKGCWVGWQGKDVELRIDLGKVRELNAVFGSFIQDSKPWILLPKTVEVLISDDGKTFRSLFVVNEKADALDEAVIRKQIGKVLEKPEKARYVKLKITHFGKLPQGHLGYPDPAYIFMDEVIIR